jgi:hypothetical protein
MWTDSSAAKRYEWAFHLALCTRVASNNVLISIKATFPALEELVMPLCNAISGDVFGTTKAAAAGSPKTLKCKHHR